MIRIVVIGAGVAVVVVVGFVVWTVAGPMSAPAPAPQKFDTTGGQEMQPRWNRQEGEGDGAAN